jgi:hypothetical protein
MAIKISSPEHYIKIGMSMDMGYCQGIRRDGKPCSMVLNRRVTDYCDFHISQAIGTVAMNRPQFLTKLVLILFMSIVLLGLKNIKNFYFMHLY